MLNEVLPVLVTERIQLDKVPITIMILCGKVLDDIHEILAVKDNVILEDHNVVGSSAVVLLLLDLLEEPLMPAPIGQNCITDPIQKQ